METTTATVSPTTALLRHRVSCLIAALLAVGSIRLGVNPVIGVMLVADTALLFDVRMGGEADVTRLIDGAVVYVVTINNFSWPPVTV
jgi:hypothetical protein